MEEGEKSGIGRERKDRGIKRMEQALEWIAEGKGRNWKYEKR